MVLRAALFSCPFVRSKNEGNNTFFRDSKHCLWVPECTLGVSGASPYNPVTSHFMGVALRAIGCAFRFCCGKRGKYNPV